MDDLRIILCDAFKVVLEYFIPSELLDEHEFTIAEYLCEYAPETIIKYLPNLSSRWPEAIIRSNNMELISKCKFACLYQQCPMMYATRRNSAEVFRYLFDNKVCSIFQHREIALIECCYVDYKLVHREGTNNMAHWELEKLSASELNIDIVEGNMNLYLNALFKHRGSEFTIKYMREHKISIADRMNNFYPYMVEQIDILKNKQVYRCLQCIIHNKGMIISALKFDNARKVVKAHRKEFLSLTEDTDIILQLYKC